MWRGRWAQKAQSGSYTCNVFCNNYRELFLSDQVLHIGYMENCFQEGSRNISQGSQNTPTITPNLEKQQKKQREVKTVKAITNVVATADKVESFEIFRVKGYLYDAPNTLFEFISLQLNCSLASQLIFSGIS